MKPALGVKADCRHNAIRILSGRLIMRAIVVCVGLMAAGCGTRKNTPISRNWQAFTTRYNVYFNGAEHYNETLKEMERNYEDDYSRLLLTHPSEARGEEGLPQPAGDFTRTIEKMQKAIRLHSITRKPARRSSSRKDKDFRARDEFNPFLHNAWLMLGKARYHNGDFLGAATTFLYISKHFTWLPETVTEARLWQARCYCALGWTYETENVLHLVREKSLVNGDMRYLYNLVKGDYLIRTGDFAGAAPFIREAASEAGGVQKNRLWYLLGQIYSRLGENGNAYGAFRKAGKGAGVPYRVKFNARIRESEVYSGGDVKGEVSSLKRMARFERNKEYLDQIYYAIGNLYLSRGDTMAAKSNYLLAIEKSTRGGIDKALADITLGRLYFDQGDYIAAQPRYSEGVSVLPEDFPGYRRLRDRSDMLDELAVYSANVHLQDSLLRLADMTAEEREEVCRKIVMELERKEREDMERQKREEYLESIGNSGSPAESGNAGNFPVFVANTGKSWYFYNPALRESGKSDFQRRWGARKLEDDWRRRDKTTFPIDEEQEDLDDIESPDTESEESHDGDIDNPHSIEYYLKRIPMTQEEKTVANDIILESLYNMGLILKDKLGDYQAAERVFTQLETRYPDNIYRLDVYYNRYLMAARKGDMTLAGKWRERILLDFPESAYGKAMINPDYLDNLRRMHEVQEGMYAEAYAAYLSDDNGRVHDLTGTMERDYPLSPILPKFVFIDGLSYLTEGDHIRFKDRLTELLQKWPDTDMTEMAGGILKKLRSGAMLKSGNSNSRGMLWSVRLTSDNGEIPADSMAADFKDEPDSPHYLVLAFPLDSVNPNIVLYETARFNFSSFLVKDYDLEPMSFSNIGLLVIKGFRNLGELEHYRSVLGKSDTGLPAGIRPVMISKDNFELLLREGRSFEEYFRFQEEAAVKRTEEEL